MGFLRVSENKRYFVRDGKPFFWMGDTMWPAVSWYTMEELEKYFKIRNEQGFTVTHFMLPWNQFEGTEDFLKIKLPPEVLPLWHDNNPAKPNEAYFEKLDQIIALAAKYDILVTILPNGGGGGTHVEKEKIITMENIRTYAKFLGKRYRDEPNIVWVNGFDLPPWMHQDLALEFNAGLLEEDGGNHLLFYHPCGATSSSHFHNEDWLSGNFIQTFEHIDMILPLVTADYNRYPAKPVVFVEGAYEAGTEYATAPITSWHAREQAYWAYLSGAFHTYGHNDLWRKLPSWEDAMYSRGARQMKVLKDVFTSLDWWKLVPDNKLINQFSRKGHVAARSFENDFAIIYYAHRWTLDVEIGRLGGGKPITGEWIDPQNGEQMGKAVFTDPVCRITSPAGCDDAILLLTSQ